MVAGLNAARQVRGLDSVVLGRESSYIGVLDRRPRDARRRRAVSAVHVAIGISPHGAPGQRASAACRRSASGVGSTATPSARSSSAVCATKTQALRLAESTSIDPARAAAVLARAASAPLPHAVRIVEVVKRQGVTLTTFRGGWRRERTARERGSHRRARAQVRGIFHARTRSGGEAAAYGRILTRPEHAVRRLPFLVVRVAAETRRDSTGDVLRKHRAFRA